MQALDFYGIQLNTIDGLHSGFSTVWLTSIMDGEYNVYVTLSLFDTKSLNGILHSIQAPAVK